MNTNQTSIKKIGMIIDLMTNQTSIQIDSIKNQMIMMRNTNLIQITEMTLTITENII